MMFYQFGYEYILSSNADNIRQIFNGSDLSWQPSKLVCSANEALEPHGQQIDYPLIGIVIEPKELCSFAVFFPSMRENNSAIVVCFPGINDDFDNFYEHQEQNQKVQKELIAVYPTQINSESSNIRITIDICDPRSKGCANKLYRLFTGLNKSDILNLHVSIKSSEKAIQSNDDD